MRHSNALDDFQVAQGEWADKVFTGQTPEGKLRHLLKEVEKEVIPSIRATAIETRLQWALDHGENCKLDTVPCHTADIVEFADAFMLLLDAARKCGISGSELLNAAWEKLYINRERNWGALNTEGFSEHVKEPENATYQDTPPGTVEDVSFTACRYCQRMVLADDCIRHERLCRISQATGG